MKYFVILALIAIIGSLGGALFFMMQQNTEAQSRDQKMLWALAFRVGISIVLFISLLTAWKLGYIHPTGIAAGQ